LVAALVSTEVFPNVLWAQPRRAVIMASGSVDGAYYPIAGAISRITSAARDLNFLVAVESSAGSIANVQLLKSGEADFALLQNDVAYYAFNGITLDAFAGKPVKNLTGVFSVYPEIVPGFEGARPSRNGPPHDAVDRPNSSPRPVEDRGRRRGVRVDGTRLTPHRGRDGVRQAHLGRYRRLRRRRAPTLVPVLHDRENSGEQLTPAGAAQLR
jgi:NMT1 family protein